jgi:ribose 5-phosphate isomerase B
MRIALASDHAGYPLKEHLKTVLAAEGHQVSDLDRAIVLGGSGQGEQIAANKVRGARAALCHDLYLARLSREHNDANVLAMGARVIAPTYAEEVVRVWLTTEFAGGRHVARIEQITQIEQDAERGEGP